MDSARLALIVNGELYFPLSLPFGLKPVPWALTKVMRPVLAYLQMNWLNFLSYIDDFA